MDKLVCSDFELSLFNGVWQVYIKTQFDLYRGQGLFIEIYI